MLNFIRNIDGYGYEMSLNFNRKGNAHQTVFGGLITIVIYTVLIVYTVFLNIQVFTYDKDSLTNLKIP